QAKPTADPWGGSIAGGISASGRYVVFESDAPNLVPGDTNHVEDVFLHDRKTGRTTRVNVNGGSRQANGPSGSPAISADGRYVAFQCSATNLVAGDTNRLGDVFVRDRRTGKTERVSVSSRGRQGGADRTGNGSNAPVISANGRYVAFHSADSNLVPGD